MSPSLSPSLVYDMVGFMPMKLMLHDELFHLAQTGINVSQAYQQKAVAIVEKKLQKMHMKNEKIHHEKTIIKGQWTAYEDRYMKIS